MLSKRFPIMLVSIFIAFAGFVGGASKPAEAATIGTFGDSIIREIRIVRLYGARIASATTPVIETGGTDGVRVDLNRFRNSTAADFGIDTGVVPAGEFAMGWFRYTGSMTFNNTTSQITNALILTDMLIQGRITDPDPTKVNTLEAAVTLTQDDVTVFSANFGGAGTTALNTRTGTGSIHGGQTMLYFSPFSTSTVEYSFFARVAVNAPQPSAVPLPASALMLLGALAMLRLRRLSHAA